MEIRYLKICFVFFLGLWALVTFIGNLLALRGTYNACARVSSLTGVPPAVTPFFANRSVTLNWLAAAGIIVGKASAAAFLLLGFSDMLQARAAESAVFNGAKHWALFGGWVNVLWLFVGFAFLGETVFYMFTNERGVAEANSAFRYTGYFALALLFIAQPD